MTRFYNNRLPGPQSVTPEGLRSRLANVEMGIRVHRRKGGDPKMLEAMEERQRKLEEELAAAGP